MYFYDYRTPENNCYASTPGADDPVGEWHIQADFEVVHVRGEPGIIQYDTVEKPYQTGSILILGPNVPHQYRSAPGSFASACILFRRRFITPDFFDLGLGQELREFLDLASGGLLLPQVGESAVGLINNVLTGSGVARAAYFMLLLDTLSKHRDMVPFNVKEPDSRNRFSRLRDVMAYISNHAAEGVSLDDAARAACMSTSHFSRFFHQTTGVSFSEYRLRVRIEEACLQLSTTGMSITEIAYAAGFDSLSAFNRGFSKMKGQSPRDYRKRFAS
jgi:AraC-type DNA-binding domain-containing proteins